MDVRVGMEVYATTGPRIEGRIRVNREDFAVEELMNLHDLSLTRGGGYDYPVYLLKKSGIDTVHATGELSSHLRSRVIYAGMKDSNAVTTQYVGPTSKRSLDPERIQGSKFEAVRKGYLERRLSRSQLVGNRFTIALTTDQEEDVRQSIARTFHFCEERLLPNYFGYQRFGLVSPGNHDVGRAIIKRDFEAAISLLVATEKEGSQCDEEQSKEARTLAREGRYRESLRVFPRGNDLERLVVGHLADKPQDYLGALRRIPILLRRLIVQAYQSYLFNLTLSRALTSSTQIVFAESGDNWAEVLQDGLRVGKVHGVKEEPPKGGMIELDGKAAATALPLVQLVGYAFRDYSSRFDSIVVSILRDEGVEARHFYIKEADEMSAEGGFRHAPLLAGGLAVERRDRGGPLLKFSLGRGEYATVLLREILKPADPRMSGF